MSDIGGVRMYFGTASGSARKALRQMEEPHVMLSSQSTAATPWDGIGDLFVDSGGYSLMLAKGEHPPPGEYLDVVESYDADRFGAQDYPCEPEILDDYGRTVAEHQQMTIDSTAACFDAASDRGTEADPVAVVQGWDTHEYLEHVDALDDHGLLTDHVAVGSVCRRNAVDEISEILTAVGDALPSRCRLHAFGVKNQVMRSPAVRDALYSADTTAWYFRNYNKRNAIDDTWQEMVDQYIGYRRNLAELAGCLHEPESDDQSAIGRFGRDEAHGD